MTISLAIFQLTARCPLVAPAPIMAVAFVFVVLIGMPKNVETSKLPEAASSAAKP